MRKIYRHCAFLQIFLLTVTTVTLTVKVVVIFLEHLAVNNTPTNHVHVLYIAKIICKIFRFNSKLKSNARKIAENSKFSNYCTC